MPLNEHVKKDLSVGSGHRAMMIVNADDFGRSRAETEVALKLYKAGRITSATAMVFMEDSRRAAEEGAEAGIDLGLHLNLSQSFTGEMRSARLREYHNSVVRFITARRYSRCIYHPALRRQFRYVYEAQVEEFIRLYGRHPSHIDGHHHMHLCSNIVFDNIIPSEQRVRRNFSFRAGEKGSLNRAYRFLIDKWLGQRYKLADFFFSLQHCLEYGWLPRVFELARSANVEVMTHPVNPREGAYLMTDTYRAALDTVPRGSYSAL